MLDSGSLKIQYNRNRYYDYYTGRWLTQDPLGITPNAEKPNKFNIIGQYEDELGLYQYVRSNPISRFDPSGLFIPDVHKTITEAAFREIVQTLPSPKPSAPCQAYMALTLAGLNMAQDYGKSKSSIDPRRHYMRPPKEGETDADKLAADKAYEKYLFEEWLNFGHELSKKPPACGAALEALGRMDHSLQDFYGHAIRRDDGFKAWSVGVTGDPGNRDNFWPLSKREHRVLEPLRGGERIKRFHAAIDYMKEHYDSYLGKWWEICHCWCNCRGK